MNSIFEIPGWETLRIAGIGRTRTGKTTFFASNAIPPIYAIDADKGYVRTRKAMVDTFPEVTGEIYYPSNKGCLVPLLIHQEAERNIFDKNIKTTVVDSVTKIYGFNTRPAVMAGRMSPQQREKYGFSKNKASNLQNKADAIQVLTYLAGYGTHIFYIWHEQETVDMESVKQGKMETIMRESMSKEERKRLFTSIDVVLRFSVEKGRYAITVDPETRGYGAEPNTGFTIYDYPGNYWRGALARIYGLIYTTFDSKTDAIAWGQQKLGIEDSVEAEAWYEEIKTKVKPENHSQMWVFWMLAVEEKFLARQKNGPAAVSKNEKGEEKPEPKPTPPPSPEEQPEPRPEAVTNVTSHHPVEFEDPVLENAHALGVPGEFEEIEPAQQADEQDETDEEPLAKAVLGKALADMYTSGRAVAEEDWDDFVEYRLRFGKVPYDADILHRAMSMKEEWPQ